MNCNEDMQHHKPKMLDDSLMRSKKSIFKAVTEDVSAVSQIPKSTLFMN